MKLKTLKCTADRMHVTDEVHFGSACSFAISNVSYEMKKKGIFEYCDHGNTKGIQKVQKYERCSLASHLRSRKVRTYGGEYFLAFRKNIHPYVQS